MCELFVMNISQFYISDDDINKLCTLNVFFRIGNEFLLIIHILSAHFSLSLKVTLVVASGMEQSPWSVQC